METILHIVAPIIMLASSVFGFNTHTVSPSSEAPEVAQTSVEFELYETSPKGAAGGFAIPASGCAPADIHDARGLHDCSTMPDISVDKPIIPYGESVTVSWDPTVHTGCVLSANLGSIAVSSTGSTVTTPTGETSYSIVCDGVGNQDSVTVKVLPRIQET
jgi:hypothetical protein